jgi:opacity protein-like surface antigen
MMKRAFWVGVVLLFGSAAFAQDQGKAEVSVNYSYIRFNPQNNQVPGLSAFSLNGGGGAFSYFFTNLIGIKAEFEGYGSQTRFIPTADANVSANLFTYNVGPVIKVRTGRFQPFAEALFGGAHSNADVNICTAVQCVHSPSNNAFDFIIGGGLDIKLTHSIAFRPAEVDYVLTRFGNGFTNGNNNQSNFRYQAGFVFSF